MALPPLDPRTFRKVTVSYYLDLPYSLESYTDNILLSRYRIPHGISLLIFKNGATFTGLLAQYPSQDQVEDALYYYAGGHIYDNLTTPEIDAITAAGFGYLIKEIV